MTCTRVVKRQSLAVAASAAPAAPTALALQDNLRVARLECEVAELHAGAKRVNCESLAKEESANARIMELEGEVAESAAYRRHSRLHRSGIVSRRLHTRLGSMERGCYPLHSHDWRYAV